MFRGMGVSAVSDFSARQLMPSFPKVSFISSVWGKYFSRRSYAPSRQSVPSSGGQFDDLLSFYRHVSLHSSSCWLDRGFKSLQSCQGFGKYDFILSSCPALGSQRVDSVSPWSGVIVFSGC